MGQNNMRKMFTEQQIQALNRVSESQVKLSLNDGFFRIELPAGYVLLWAQIQISNDYGGAHFWWDSATSTYICDEQSTTIDTIDIGQKTSTIDFDIGASQSYVPNEMHLDGAIIVPITGIIEQ